MRSSEIQGRTSMPTSSWSAWIQPDTAQMAKQSLWTGRQGERPCRQCDSPSCNLVWRQKQRGSISPSSVADTAALRPKIWPQNQAGHGKIRCSRARPCDRPSSANNPLIRCFPGEKKATRTSSWSLLSEPRSLWRTSRCLGKGSPQWTVLERSRAMQRWIA